MNSIDVVEGDFISLVFEFYLVGKQTVYAYAGLSYVSD
jgi:hypothetical protein